MGGGSKRLIMLVHALSGSAIREKVGTFSLPFLAVTWNFYDILAAPKFIYIFK